MISAKETFEYYCLDRIKPVSEELNITYKDDGLIRKLYYKVGLRAKVKHVDCFILYTATDDDLDTFLFMPVDYFYDNQARLMLSVIDKDEYMTIIKRINTINIFEFVSLLDFMYIYDDFKTFVEYNWQVLSMDSLIEV